MNKFSFYFILTFISGVILFFLSGSSTFGSLLINIVAAAILFLLEYIFECRKHLWLFILTHTFYSKKTIRFSISYLYQIKVMDKYLLHRGSRIKHQFQPIGGVYKRYKESFYQLQTLKVLDDSNIPIDDKSIDDLRVKLPGKNVIKFLNWYNSQFGREVSPYREFYEELIRPGVVTQAVFPYTNYIHLHQIQTPLHFSEHFQCHEILISEIFRLMPNDEQIKELEAITTKDPDNFVWVTEETINRLGADRKIVVSPTAKWII